MKETEEEEIFKKVKDELSKHPIKLPLLDHMKAFAKLYHQERMKSILPSEQEIEKKMLSSKTKFISTMERFSSRKSAYKNGWRDCSKYILELLTKGDR